ncbi:MAG: sensor histidine kinase [Oscillospiraceae bacterium]|nr:sensor histidine kinase [Oscillospiraceae bacterium]
MKLALNLQNHLNRYKMSTQIMIIYIVVLIPVFIGSIFLLNSINNIMRENAEAESFSSADSLRTRLQDMIYIAENISNSIATSSDVIDFIDNPTQTTAKSPEYYAGNEVINNYINVSPQIKYVRIFLEKENFIYNSNYRFATQSVRSQSWYWEAKNNNSVKWRVITDSVDNNIYLSYVRSIRNEKGNVIGVAVIEISPEWISDFFAENAFNAIFSVNNGVTFYSDIEGIKPGTVIASGSSDIFIADKREVIKENFMGMHGLTVMETFRYGSTTSIFQIFIISPNNGINARSKQLTYTAFIYTAFIVLFFLISLFIIVVFASLFTERIKLLRDRMHSVAGGSFDEKPIIRGNDEVYELDNDLSIMVKSMQEMMYETYKAKLQTEALKSDQIEAEFKALSSQINPHFLYNTLETIRMKAFVNNDKETANLIKKLGKFMRRCLEFKDKSVTLESELDFINSYLELQSARFGDKITYEIINEVDNNLMILPLLIQPAVENAFVHGIESSKKNGKITIHCYYDEEFICIDVKDNGQGMSEEKLRELKKKLIINDTSSGKSIGLTNVNKRIKMYFGDAYGLFVYSTEGEGTVVRIALPRKMPEIARLDNFDINEKIKTEKRLRNA